MGCIRHSITAIIFVGVILTYMLRVNLSVAILAMVNRTALAEYERNVQMDNNLTMVNKDSEGICKRANVSEHHEQRLDGPFLWDQKTRGLILASFFYGYLVTQLPGGWLAYRFGAKWILGCGMMWTAIFTLLTPLTVYLDFRILILLRVLEGLGEGVAFPCFHGLFSQWVPPSERSRIPSVIFAGIGMGTVIAYPFSAALSNSSHGWPLVFYVFGTIGLCWCIVWLIFGSSTPANCKWIGADEREYIRKALAETVVEERPSCGTVPWAEIFKTPAMWAVWISHIAETWGFHTLITLLPTFYDEVLNFGISKNGLFAAIPYVFFTIVCLTAGQIMDYLLARKMVTISVMRKVADGIGHILPGIFLLATTAIGCNATAALILMCFALGSAALIGVGSFANNVDVSGRYAGVTFGIGNTFGAICGIIAPYLAGAITQGSRSMYRWRIVFGIVAGFYWFAALFFIIFGQGHAAKWAVVNKKKEQNANEMQVQH